LLQDLVRNIKENLSEEQFAMAQSNLIDKQQLLNLAKQVEKNSIIVNEHNYI